MSRTSCPVPDEISPTELQNPLQHNAEMKGQSIAASSKHSPPDHEASTFKPLGIVLALADSRNQVTTSATTTTHPWHSPQCICIACIHPLSSGGLKHNPACMCNICITINRRFFTPQKRKHQFEQEEAESQKRLLSGSDKETEVDSSLKCFRPLDPFQENVTEKLEMCKGSLDLYCHLEHEYHTQSDLACVSMMSLFPGIVHPLGAYLKQNGLASLAVKRAQTSKYCRKSLERGREGPMMRASLLQFGS